MASRYADCNNQTDRIASRMQVISLCCLLRWMGTGRNRPVMSLKQRIRYLEPRVALVFEHRHLGSRRRYRLSAAASR
jgi:hypothetical protein